MAAIERSDCQKEYAKNPKLRKDDIQHLINWVEKAAQLPKISEFMIIHFYVASEYSLLKTKSLIDGHYKFRNEAPELFLGRDLDKEKLNIGFLDSWYYNPLDVTENSIPTIYVGLRHTDASKFTWECFSTMLLKAHLTTIFSKGSCEECNWVLDAEGFGFAHLASARITLSRQVISYLQSYIPMKIPKIYLVRMNPFAEKFYFLVKQFFSEEMNKKVCILPDVEKVFDFVPRECVPRDFPGGLLFETRAELNEIERKRLAALDDVIMAEMSLKSDESKQIHNKSQDFTRVDSFKQLQID